MNVAVGLPPPRPIPIKDRSSILFIERGQLDVIDGAFVVVDARGVRVVIPIGGIACLMLEPGSRVSHAAVALAARAGTLLIWVGEAGVRLYAAGQPGGARADRLLYQARLALDDDARLRVVRRMYERRFGEEAPSRRSVDQLRGIEGARVREMYRLLAQRHGVSWEGRRYDPNAWDAADLPNRCLSAATAALYGLCEAAILAAGYAPAIGFLHTRQAAELRLRHRRPVQVRDGRARGVPGHRGGGGGPPAGWGAGVRPGSRGPSSLPRRVSQDGFAVGSGPIDRGRAGGRRLARARGAGGDAAGGDPDPEPSGDAGHRG